MKTMDFQDQVVIITGGSAGIGRALAIKLASHGAKVAIAARRVEHLDEVASQCRLLGAEALAVPTDVSDELQCKQLIERTVGTFGRLDMLINNAGMAMVGLFEDLPNLSNFHHVMDINFYGYLNCTYYALPYLKQSEGRLVAISSLAGKAAIPYNASYCSSKHALQGFFDSLRPELRQHGISVTVISPWWVKTEFQKQALNQNGTKLRESYSESDNLHKEMSAERCAEIILRAAYKRRREVLMNPGFLAVMLRAFSPSILDWVSSKLIIEPAIKQAKAFRDKDSRDSGMD